jgi:hypothetical protein
MGLQKAKKPPKIRKMFLIVGKDRLYLGITTKI